MGMPGGTTEKIRAAADGAAAELLASLADQRRAENCAAAAVVRSVHDLSELRMSAELRIHESGDGEPDVTYARRAVECEGAVALSLSKIVTRDMIVVGAQLAWRLPSIDAAFANGDVDYPRVRAIALLLQRASDSTVSALEDDILSAARRCNVRALRERIWKAWFLHDADEAAEAQAAAASEERCADIRRADDGTATLNAKMTTLEGAECSAMLDEVAGTVCSRDPRTKRQLRGFALLALVHREDYIACRCSRDDCPVRDVAEQQPARRKPLLQIMIDIETLLGLSQNPATLADGTVLDPDIARQVAGDARWQLLLTEMLDAARSTQQNSTEKASSTDSRTDDEQPNCTDGDASNGTPGDGVPGDGVPGDDDGGGDGGGGGHGDGEGDGGDGGGGDDDGGGTDGGGDGGAGNTGGGSLPLTPPGSPSRPRVRRLLRRGSVRPAASVPARRERRTPKPTANGSETALSKVIADFLRAVAADPSLGRGVHPDGHGGLTDPPPGALTYRPSAELTALTRATHCTCTFPGCSVPAARCEIDHVVPFDRSDPMAGGWTILSNLQPLCKFHHQAKTMKLWAAAKLDGESVYWVSTSGLHRVTPSDFCTVTLPGEPDPNMDADPETWPEARPERRRKRTTRAERAPQQSDPPEGLYEPTWWEANISDTDDSWPALFGMTGFVGDGTVAVPSLGNIARMSDPQQRADARFLREKFLEHRAVVAIRDHFRPPPF